MYNKDKIFKICKVEALQNCIESSVQLKMLKSHRIYDNIYNCRTWGVIGSI